MTPEQWETVTWVAIGLGALGASLLSLYLLQSIGRFLRLQWSRWEEFIQQRALSAARARRAAHEERQQQELERIEHRIRRVNLEQQEVAETLQAKLVTAERHAETMYRDLNDLHASHKKLRNENHDLRGQLHVLGNGLDHVLQRIAEQVGVELDEPVIPPLPPRVELPCLITIDDDKGQQRLATELEKYVGQANALAGDKARLEHRLRLQEEENATLRGEVLRLLQMNDARVQELSQNAEHLSLIRREQERVQQEIHQKEEELRQVRLGGEMAQAAVEDMQRRIDDLYNKNRTLSEEIARTKADGEQLRSATKSETALTSNAAIPDKPSSPGQSDSPIRPRADEGAPAVLSILPAAATADDPLPQPAATTDHDDVLAEDDLTPVGPTATDIVLLDDDGPDTTEDAQTKDGWTTPFADHPTTGTAAPKRQDGSLWSTHSSMRPPPI